MSRGVLDGATANSLAADHHGPLQDDQSVKTKLLTGSGLRGLDQGLGRARARCSRNRPLEPLCTMARPGSRVGWTSLPCTPIAAHFHGNTRSGRRCAPLGHALDKLKNVNRVHIARSFDNTRGLWFISPLNETLALAPFP